MPLIIILNSMICFLAVIKPILQTSSINKVFNKYSIWLLELFEKKILLLVLPSPKALQLSVFMRSSSLLPVMCSNKGLMDIFRGEGSEITEFRPCNFLLGLKHNPDYADDPELSEAMLRISSCFLVGFLDKSLS